MSKFYSYLDDFNQITIIVPSKYRKDYVGYFNTIENNEKLHLDTKFPLANER